MGDLGANGFTLFCVSRVFVCAFVLALLVLFCAGVYGGLCEERNG